MEKEATNKKLNRKARAEQERKELESKLLENYVEGQSNIDYDKLETAEDVWNTLIFNEEQPLMSKDEWLEREIAKIDAEKPKIPNHRVQDPNAKLAKYRQKFMEFAINSNLQIIEDLKGLAPHFKILFNKESDKKYFSVFNDLKYNLLHHWRIYPYHYNSDNYNINHSYLWDNLKIVFNLSYTKYSLSNETLTHCPTLILKAIEENQYQIEGFVDEIINAFQDTTINQDSVLPNFFHLQNKIYEWADKYHLHKDWLIKYAHYFIYQFSQNHDLESENIEIGIENYDYRRTMFYPFEFKSPGWWASQDGETASQYKARVTKEFEKHLDEYLIAASSSMDLNELPKATKPPTYKSVEWLVYSTIKGWNSERIVEKFFPDIAADRTKSEKDFKTFNNTKKHIENEMRKLKEYDLPIRENL